MNEEFNNKENTNEVNNEENINSTDKNVVEQINENIEDSNVNINKDKNSIIPVIIMFIVLLLFVFVFLGGGNNLFSSNDKQEQNNNLIEDKEDENKDNTIVEDNKDDEGNNSDVEEDVIEGSVTHKLVKVLDNEILKKDEEKNGKLKEVFQTGYYYDENYIFYDKNGNNVTKNIFEVDNIKSIDILEYEVVIVWTKDYKYGLYDKNLNEIIEIGNYIIDYDIIEGLDNEKYVFVGKNLAAYNRLENVGVYNIKGEMIIPMDYERLRLIDNQNKLLFFAKQNGKYGIIDDKNNKIIPIEYDYIFSKGPYDDYVGEIIENNGQYRYILYKNGKYGMVDSNNNVVVAFDKNELSYSKYANAVVESDYNNKKINVYNLNGELKKVIDLNKSNLEYEKAYYNKLGAKDFVFYDDRYIYLLNRNFELEKYNKPYRYEQGGIDYYGVEYFIGEKIYLSKQDDRKVKIHNTKDNSLVFNEEFYLINALVSRDIEGFVLCKNKLQNKGYSKCGIVDYVGKVIVNFDYTVDGENDYHNPFDMLSQNEKIEFNFDSENQWYMEKKKVIDSCSMNNKFYELENKILVIYDVTADKREVYNSNCTKILDSVSNNYDDVKSINDKLIMTEKYRAGKDNNSLYKIYNSSTGKLINIENKDNAVIIKNTIGKTINNEPTVVTDKGVYKIVEYSE